MKPLAGVTHGAVLGKTDTYTAHNLRRLLKADLALILHNIQAPGFAVGIPHSLPSKDRMIGSILHYTRNPPTQYKQCPKCKGVGRIPVSPKTKTKGNS